MSPAEMRLIAKSYIGECDHLPHGICKDCFVDALLAVHDAAREEGAHAALNARRLGFKEGFNDGVEKVAEMVAGTPGNTYTTDCDHEALAEDIRSLKLSSEAGGNE